MTPYEIYVFILCTVVFVSLTALFITLLAYAIHPTVRLIRCGAEDEKIRKEYEEAKKHPKKVNWFSRIFNAIICIVLGIAFAFSLSLHFTEGKFSTFASRLKVVKSSSMASCYEGNKYLSQNNLTDQLQMFDLIVTHDLPGEYDLELYDIVVYQQKDDFVIHRIVGIEEPNEKHPDCRHFRLQGDAVENPDHFPVLYSQMRAIYRSERVPFVGSFIMFLQSPAGWLCILLVIFAMVATPIVEKKIEREKQKRLARLFKQEAERAKAEQAKQEQRHRQEQLAMRSARKGQAGSAHSSDPLGWGEMLFCGIFLLLGIQLAGSHTRSETTCIAVKRKRR